MICVGCPRGTQRHFIKAEAAVRYANSLLCATNGPHPNYLCPLFPLLTTRLAGGKVMTKCTNKGCKRKATHQIALLIHLPKFPQQYRPVCKKCGKKKSLFGFHLVRDETL